MRDAACRDVDPDMFFPHAGQSHDEAKAICAACPVLDVCRDHAIRHERWGIWGGTSERERMRLRRELGIRLETAREHGTAAGYMQHLRRGEQACVSCREANTAKKRENEQRKRGAA